MKVSAYERAVEINRRLEYLRTLANLLIQSSNSTHVITATKVSDRSVHSEVLLDSALRDKFIKIINEEEKQLLAEFDAL